MDKKKNGGKGRERRASGGVGSKGVRVERSDTQSLWLTSLSSLYIRSLVT